MPGCCMAPIMAMMAMQIELYVPLVAPCRSLQVLLNLSSDPLLHVAKGCNAGEQARYRVAQRGTHAQARSYGQHPAGA